MEIRQKAIENRKKAIEAKKRQKVGEDGVPCKLDDSSDGYSLTDSNIANEPGQGSILTQPEQDNVLVHPGGDSALIRPEGDSVLIRPEEDSVLIRPEMDNDLIHPEQEISSDDSSSSDSDEDEDSDDDMPTDSLNTSESIAESRMGLCWNDEAGNHIRGPRGTSKSTEKRARRHQRELEKAASQSHSIVHLFQGQQNLGLSMQAHLEMAQEDKEKPREDEEKARQEALDDLKRLLHHEEEQRNKYGKPFATGKNFQRRHLMVESFLALQQQKQELPDPSRRGLATLVARNYGKGGHTVRKIVQWEKSWVKDRTIPESKTGTHRHNSSWMDDKALLSAVQEFIKSQGEGQLKTSLPAKRETKRK